jgi:hypothetical protein
MNLSWQAEGPRRCQVTITSQFFVAFTTRLGGISREPYNSLNLAFHVGDEASNVLKNRSLLAQSLQFPVEKLTTSQQVHGCEACLIDKDSIGAGWDSEEKAIPKTDSLVTMAKGAVLAMFFADCVPIVLVDVWGRVGGIAHAGRKGLLAGIGQKFVSFASQASVISPENFWCWIGPSIGACCYEVSEEVANKFAAKFPGSIKRVEGRPKLDLKFVSRMQLLKAGVKLENIWISPHCTSCQDKLYFSYRRDGNKTGRQAALVSIV